MNPTTYATRVGDEVFIYVMGRLVMKRWLSAGTSATFHVAPAWTRWSSRYSEVDHLSRAAHLAESR